MAGCFYLTKHLVLLTGNAVPFFIPYTAGEISTSRSYDNLYKILLWSDVHLCPSDYIPQPDRSLQSKYRGRLKASAMFHRGRMTLISIGHGLP